MNNKKILSTPIGAGDLAGLKTGDIVYLNGTLVTGRDLVYERIVLEGRASPVDLRGLAVFHAGPIVRDSGLMRDRQARVSGQARGVAGLMADQCCPAEGGGAQAAAPQGGGFPPINQWEMVAVGPTTSMRMESCQAEFLELSGARLIVGKGGMGAKTADACRRLGAAHMVFPGGCAVLAAARVEAVEAVYWLELGMAEAMWVLRVKDFGPLVVSIDAAGNNLFS
jgi:L(+)-tartrate dehydratase beta subunit